MFKKFFKKLENDYWKDKKCTTRCTDNIDGLCCNVHLCMARNCNNKNIRIGR